MSEEINISAVVEYVNQSNRPLSWAELAEQFGHVAIVKHVSSEFHTLIWNLVADGRICLNQNNQIIKGDGKDHIYP